MQYSANLYNPNQYKNLSYKNASPDKRYIKILKYFYDNGQDEKTNAVVTVFGDTSTIKDAQSTYEMNCWLGDDKAKTIRRSQLRGYAITFFGQLVNDGLLDAQKAGRRTLFSITDKGVDLLKKCGALGSTALNEEDENVPDTKELKSRIADAKKDAAKVKKPEDAKKFLDDNKAKIDELSKKMKGDQKKAFDIVINKIREYAEGKELNEGDTSAKVICGCVAVIMWLIGLGPAWIVGALSPIVGPMLLNVVKKIG